MPYFFEFLVLYFWILILYWIIIQHMLFMFQFIGNTQNKTDSNDEKAKQFWGKIMCCWKNN